MAVELQPVGAVQDPDNAQLLLDAVRGLDAYNKSSKEQNRKVQDLAKSLIADLQNPHKQEKLARSDKVQALIQEHGYISHWGGFDRWFGKSQTDKAISDVIAIWQPLRCRAIRQDYATLCDSFLSDWKTKSISDLLIALNQLLSRSSECYGAFEKTLLTVIRESPLLRKDGEFRYFVQKTLREGMYCRQLVDFLKQPAR